MTTTLTARNPEDVLAMVPVVLGFVPADSVVMLTFGAVRTFHARVDLPPPGSATTAVVESLREPAVRHGVRRVVFVLYSEEARRAERVAARLVRDFRRSGVEVVDALRADGRCWFPLLPGRRSRPATGTPYDVSAHPFAAQAVLDGRVTLASRAELAASVATDPGRAARVAAAGAPDASPAGAEWVRATLRRHASAGTSPSDAEAARLLRAVTVVPEARDAAWAGVARSDAEGHVALWTDLLRRSPEPLVPAAAGVLGLVAWLAGHGALAWCAVDRSFSAQPGHPLARLVAGLLEAAVPPSEWEEAWAMPDPA
jgi:hypothetical protein